MDTKYMTCIYILGWLGGGCDVWGTYTLYAIEEIGDLEVGCFIF